MTQYCTFGVGYSSGAPTEHQMLLKERNTPQNGTKPVIICLHGHGGDASQFLPYSVSTVGLPGYHAWSLAESGSYLVLSVDDAGGTNWGGASSMSRLDDAYTYATTTLGGKTGKVGIMGWSMGAVSSLNWIKRNPTKVACAWLWSPCTDLDWANATSGYTPSYTTFAPAGGWATEIQSVFSPYSSASTGYRIRDEYSSWHGLGIPIKLCHASDDGTIPPGQTSAFVTGVNDANVTARSPAPTGGHSNLFVNVPPSEVLAFFQANLS